MEISPSGHAATPAHDAGSAGNTLPNCSRLPSGGPLSDDDTLPVLYDMHCHLGFCPDAAGLARELSARGVGGFLCTVTPEEYQHISSPDLDPGHSNDLPSDQDPHPGPRPRWRIGVGAHPWWATDVDGDEAARIAAQAPYIGEVGLDFGKAHAATRDRQVENFSHIAAAAPAGALLSIHAVRSADTVLDLLEDTGALRRCTCIFHWYSDSNEALSRALAAGCYFSVGPLMLRSRRGREYARQLPADRLLLETDYPAENDAADPATTADTMAAALRDGLFHIADLRAMDPVALAAKISATSERLLSFER